METLMKLVVLIFIICSRVFFLFAHEASATDVKESEIQESEVHIESESPPKGVVYTKKGSQIVTGNHNVRLSVKTPDKKSTKKPAGIEITIQPDSLTTSERFTIMVFAVDSTEKKVSQSGEEYLGSHTFFAPIKIGHPFTFFVKPPKKLELTDMQGGVTLDIEIRLEPITPKKSLKRAALTVLSARFIE